MAAIVKLGGGIAYGISDDGATVVCTDGIYRSGEAVIPFAGGGTGYCISGDGLVAGGSSNGANFTLWNTSEGSVLLDLGPAGAPHNPDGIFLGQCVGLNEDGTLGLMFGGTEAGWSWYDTTISTSHWKMAEVLDPVNFSSSSNGVMIAPNGVIWGDSSDASYSPNGYAYDISTGVISATNQITGDNYTFWGRPEYNGPSLLPGGTYSFITHTAWATEIPIGFADDPILGDVGVIWSDTWGGGGGGGGGGEVNIWTNFVGTSA